MTPRAEGFSNVELCVYLRELVDREGTKPAATASKSQPLSAIARCLEENWADKRWTGEKTGRLASRDCEGTQLV